MSNWPSRLEWGLIVGGWTTVALLTAVNEVLAPHGGEAVAWARFPGELGREIFEYAFWIVLTPIIFWGARTVSLERAHPVSAGVVHLGAAVVVAFSVDAADAWLRSLLFPDPGRTAAFDPLRILTRLWFVNELVVYLVVLAIGVARDYSLQKQERQAEAERLQERAARLERQLTEARLETLRMQLNPHFLFNTLHAVSTLVGRDPEGVRRMIARLSQLLRRVLDEDAPQEHALASEIDVLDDYLEIQQIRFQGRLDVSIDVPDAVGEACVPYLLLQPLAENAIKHGASRVRGTGRIALSAERAGDDLVLQVRDNGPGFDEDVEPGVGVRNVRERLRGLYGDDGTLQVDAAADGGVVATVRLPYHTDAVPAPNPAPDLAPDHAPTDDPEDLSSAEKSDALLLTTSAPDHDG